jgi:type I restriction enzyme S subunit
MYSEHKATEYEWVGSIPKHWKWLYLSQVCAEQDIKNTGNIEKNVLSLSYGQIMKKKNIDFGLAPKDYGTYQIVDNYNIILRLTDLQNDHRSLRTGLVRERGIITSAYTCLKPFENPAYLYLLLHSYDTQKYFYGLGGGVRQSIGYKDIRYIKVPLPTRDEQDQIVRYLDWKVSQVNKLINAKRRQIALLQEQKQIVTNTAVTKNSEEWRIVPLRQFLIPVAERNRTDLSLLSVVREQGVILRDVDDYKENHNFIPDDLSNYKVVRKGQFVMNKMKAWQGSCGVSNYDGIVSPAYYVFDLHCENKEFFHKAIRSRYYVDKFARYSIGIRIGQWDLPIARIKEIEFLLPPIREQCSIVAYLNKLYTKIGRLIGKLYDEIALFAEYRACLISDVVMGKLDVRGMTIPEDELVANIAEDEAELDDKEIMEGIA